MGEDLAYCSDNFFGEKWKSWCRLCAKSDAKCINVLSGQCQETTNDYNFENDMDFSRFILELFRIHIKEDDKLSQIICTECHGFVLSLINFTKRVTKVQQMYEELLNLPEKSSSHLRILLENYGLFKDEWQILPNDNELPVEEIFVTDLGEDLINSPKNMDIKAEQISTEHLLKDEIKNKKNEFLDPIGDGHKDECFSSSENGFNSDNEDISLSELKNIKIQKNCDKVKRKRPKRTEDPSLKSNEFCSICSQNFQRRNNYTVHMKKKHGILLCLHCPSSFKTQLNLKQHMKVHKRLFSCLHCDKTFERKGLASNHMKTEHKDHKNIPSFVCETCGEALLSQKKLSKHMLTHSGHSEPTSFVCKVCGSSLKNKYLLKRHLQIHGDKHICTECGKQLSSRATYNTHMLVHSNKMPHKCEFCGRAFKRAKGLKYHLIAHMGLKPYSCDFCDKTFSTGSSCRFHKKTMHPAELAALEASGAKAYTKNVPNIDELKAVARVTKHWTPLQSKQNGYVNLKSSQETPQPDEVKTE